MNCLEKMYKEIEEILNKEKIEQSRMNVPIKEIKHGFDDVDDVPANLDIDFLSMITYDEQKADKKYFDNKKASLFIEFIFKKYYCFNKGNEKVEEFVKSIPDLLKEKTDLILELKNLENVLLNIVGESQELESYFTNPYHALYKDEKGYYAVILNGRFSNVQRPFGYNLNQLKKIIKETVDVYTEDFSSKFSNEKERISLINKVKADINKSTSTELALLEKEMEDAIFDFLKNKGVSQEGYQQYLEDKGFRLIKQGNYYYRKKAYEEYAEYKKIEFRY